MRTTFKCGLMILAVGWLGLAPVHATLVVTYQELPAGSPYTTVPEPTNSDHADTNVGNGVTITNIVGDLIATFEPAGRLIDGGTSDAIIFVNAEDPAQLMMDLRRSDGRQVRVSEINTFSEHGSTRNDQVYSLYGSGASVAPNAGANLLANGWTLITSVDTINDSDNNQVRVHIVVRLPRAWGEERVGLTSNALVTHGDILPTLVRAAGGEVPAWSDGRDLLPVVRGEKDDVRTHLEGYWLENAYWIDGYDQPDYLGITDGDWKYIWYPEGGREQLFDLVNDPGETRNLAAAPAQHAKLRELRDELIARQATRGLTSVRNGELVAIPEIPIAVRLIRAQCHYGLHGESWSGRGQPNGDILH